MRLQVLTPYAIVVGYDQVRTIMLYLHRYIVTARTAFGAPPDPSLALPLSLPSLMTCLHREPMMILRYWYVSRKRRPCGLGWGCQMECKSSPPGVSQVSHERWDHSLSEF